MLALDSVNDRRRVFGVDVVVEPATVGYAQVAKRQVVEEELAVSGMEGEDQVGDAEALADLVLHVDNWA